MNSENQAIDLCNANTKPGVNNTTAHISEEIIPRNSLHLMDVDAGKQPGDAEALEDGILSLTRATGYEDNVNEKGNEEQLLQKNNGNGITIAPAAVISDPSDDKSDDNKQQKSSKDESALADEGDMDIGVDISLDESGVLESEPAMAAHGTTLKEEIASSCTGGNSLTSNTKTDSDKELQISSEPGGAERTGVLSLSLALEEGTGPKHGVKRVTFPSDEEIVSGSVEPKDPWRHAQNVTVEEILNAYRQACQKLNCKPIPKVLKQIQDLTDLTQRNECLDLKGEKLDYKACESLEEIFKRVQFKLVDLEQTNLDEDGASALFDMIEYYESATHLNISFNKHIGTRGWQAAAHMMRKTSSLQYLDARNTPLLDHSAPFVARALRISGSLAVLHLENAGISGRPLMLLATALKMNMNLRELYLADNKLNGLQDSAQLGNLLKFNYNIQILDLRNNHILDSGLAYVCEGLKEQRKGLVTLVLWNNQLSHNGMGYLAAALPCTQSLETLNLGHNAIGNEGVHKLKDGLIANRSVLRLGLASTKLACEGAVAVAEFIAESPRLLRLDLRENEIKTGGLMALSLALKVNTSLLRLDLDREPKKETVKSFIETQRALLAEIQNGCKRNFILAKEKEESQQQMSQSASMVEIATEDPPPEEEEEDPTPSTDQGEGEKPAHEGNKDEEDSEKLAKSQEEEVQTAVTTQEDSDSDTDDDEVEIEVIKPTVQTSPLKQTPPPTSAIPVAISASQSVLTSSPIPSPTPSPAITLSESPAMVSNITVKEASLPSGAPPSPGRCISVSSPGRGHKIFMVTRVESPPEQQQLQQQSIIALARSLQERAPESKASATAAATKPVDTKAPSESLSEQSETKLDSKSTDNSTFSAQQISESSSQAPSENTGAAKPQSQPEQTPLIEPVSVIEQGPLKQEAQASLLLPLQTTTAQQHSSTVDKTELNAVQQEQRPLSEEHPGENAAVSLVEPLAHSNSNSDEQQPIINSELPETENPTNDTHTGQIVQSEGHTVTSSNQATSAAEPQTATPPQPITEAYQEEHGRIASSAGTEDSTDSPDESSTEEVECINTDTAALPNGLKPEFAFHLLEPEAPKAACCVMEHMSVTAELSCGQDLEELLLEASLDTSRDTP
uniref:Protein phosphatase 1 regulatory subunit 37 n=1 Tax=Astyanax mexicanus TaxID=7994 RepID=W5LE43_ASTMX